jgi:hypothetical protein
MIKPKIFGVTLLAVTIAASVIFVATAFQNAMATAQTADGNTTAVEFLSIQNARSGSISQINETAYTLELNNVANGIIQFSDRPERIVESISTTDFIGSWTAGPNSFESDVPNDALIVEDTKTGNLETAIIESFNPMYDANTNTLTYTIMTDNATSIDLPSEFGQTVLVIDVTPDSETSLICAVPC